MRSVRGLVGAAAILVSYPAALAVQQVFGGGAPTVIHFVMGAGFVIFATSVFDFGLPRWVNLIGATAAGAFGGIFLMQGVSDVTHVEGLRYVAFDVLGHHVERLLPDVVYLWFLALLLVASRGRSRILGAVVMLIVVGLEITTLVTLLLGAPMDSVKILILLPFVWLLFEGYGARHDTRSGHRADVAVRPAAGSATDLPAPERPVRIAASEAAAPPTALRHRADHPGR